LDYRVAEHLDFHVIDPGNADGIIYTCYCLGEADAPSCGTFLFDGSKKKKWKIVPANASLLFYPADDRRNSWSANGKYAIFRGDDSKGAHLYFLDLTTGGSVDLAKQFSAIGRRTTPWFEGWAPDGNKAAVVMATVLDPHPPERNFEDDLWSIEFNPLKARYLGSMRGETGWEKGSYQWTKEGDEYRISITPSDRIFQKAKEKLPTP
jgi:hypothetical protein